MSDEQIYKKFIYNNGEITIDQNEIRIDLKKKRELPNVIDFVKKSKKLKYPWLNNKVLNFFPSASS
jgi:hypothetical protein